MPKMSNNKEKANKSKRNMSKDSKANRNNAKDKAKAAEGSKVESKGSGSYSFASPAIANIVNASSSIAVRNIAGNPVYLPVSDEGGARFSSTPDGITLPGIIGIGCIPTIGYASGKQTDPINLAARNIWMNLRGLYSNRIPYTAGAIVQYVVALDSIVTAFQTIKRAYGVVYAYDVRNRYVPDGLLIAMGIDPVDFRANLPYVKSFMNKLATQLSSFGIPTDIRLILDHVDMASHIYMDGTAANSMFLVPTPEFVWKMDWTANKLTHFRITSFGMQSGATWSTLSERMTELVEAFVNNEDVYQIASDMMRLYGNLATVTALDESYMVGPEFDQAFLDRMHNATFGFTYTDSTTDPWCLTEVQAVDNVGAISAVYSAGFPIGTNKTAAMLHALTPGIFDFHVSDPSIDDVINAASYKYYLEPCGYDKNGLLMRVGSCGSVMLGQMCYVIMAEDPVTHVYGPVSKPFTIVESQGKATVANDGLNALYLWNQHPLVPQGAFGASGEKTAMKVGAKPTQPIGDLDQYVTIGCSELKRIHEAMMLDKFDAAGIGTLNLKAKK